jgi:hypothetical protein
MQRETVLLFDTAVRYRPLDPLVPTNVPTDLTWRGEKASELEPRYGIEP